MQVDKKRLQELSCEVQRTEEWLQEERMEREQLEVELGSERDCHRVSKLKCNAISIHYYANVSSFKYKAASPSSVAQIPPPGNLRMEPEFIVARL